MVIAPLAAEMVGGGGCGDVCMGMGWGKYKRDIRSAFETACAFQDDRVLLVSGLSYLEICAVRSSVLQGVWANSPLLTLDCCAIGANKQTEGFREVPHNWFLCPLGWFLSTCAYLSAHAKQAAHPKNLERIILLKEIE